ncbi:transcriptional repressor NrdR [Halanaerobiaceae bacterium Z-7014]|uniref:Transcriptional repressor NrdR n=1 Tax=Halonatronomonas betaini TaxID=2778430 RepID=A0A931ARI2_9FIRM|nr:transcriptional regulator NrdR [Halonatronomonas betaini]MBF8437632.1 transcriptional repressor NrdR [Halonatronomonas betaini]
MKCPFCSNLNSKVIDSRTTENNTTIRRRRECLDCQERFTTYERYEKVPLMVRKKDGTREMFSEDKILAGLYKACEKRSISPEKLNQLVIEVKQELQNRMDEEVTSDEIGKLVMKKLKDLDQVAYVRFASVYRQFKDVETFKKELDRLLKDE